MDIKDLIEYNWYCRRMFLDSFQKLPWEAIIEDRGASFGSIRNIFLHGLEAEEGFFRHLASGKIGEWPSHDYDREFRDIDAMRKYMEDVEDKGRAYLKKVGTKGLDKLFPVSWFKESFRVEDVLMGVVGECIYHNGEIMSLMWQIDAEPPYKDYLGYLLETGKRERKGIQKKKTRIRE